MKINTWDKVILRIFAFIIVTMFALFAFLPFIILIISSFSSEHEIINNGYQLIPKDFSLDAYKLIFQYPEKILNSYFITIVVTVIGTISSLFLSSMAAYVLFRKEIKYRNHIAFLIYFTELFQGGLASYYIVVSRMYGLKDTIWVLLLVPLFSVFNILILRNFMKNSIPYSLVESAIIDGCDDFKLFLKIILPMSKPALASIGLFIALIYWNDWWTPMMFVEEQSLHPLQYTLYQTLNSVNLASNVVGNVSAIEMPKESLKLALTVVSTGPIIFLYPFVQKYFVKGISIGAVKE